MPKVVVTDKKGLVQESSTMGGLHLQGGGSAKPGYIALTTPDGSTVFYLFVDDNGKLRIHNAVPTANNQGTIVGTQAA